MFRSDYELSYRISEGITIQNIEIKELLSEAILGVTVDIQATERNYVEILFRIDPVTEEK